MSFALSRASALLAVLFACVFVRDASAFVKGAMGVSRQSSLISVQPSVSSTLLCAAKKAATTKKVKTKKAKVAKKKAASASAPAAAKKATQEGFSKSELIRSVAEKTDLTKADSERALNAVIDTIMEQVADDKKVQINGFGSFNRRYRSARSGRNPQTGEEMQIAASYSPGFTVSKKFKELVNE